jgi:catechol 2,3-dioxygenase-like lactoylglutathione lyase family enzyme
MLKVTEIAFSCYPVTDMARARKFYEDVLGLKATMAHGEPGGMQWTEYEIANGTFSIGAGAPGWKPTSDGRGLRRSHRAPEGERREVQDGAVPHARLLHGVHLRPGWQHDLHP